jgi:hypothetical protein
MVWERPSFQEIRMDAELTYVDDLDRDAGAERPPAASDPGLARLAGAASAA